MLPTVDFCFKELMQNPTVRQGFIAALLGVPPEEVAETVLLPTLEEGEYTLSVTTQFSQSHTLKEPRTYVYPVTLTVGTDEGGGTPGGV